MEFEQYLEKDILTFLDSKIARKENTSIDREEEYGLYLTKDYLKELNYALDNDELTRAKKLFDELKATYARLPKNSLERKKIYSLLERMYDKIQNYVRIKEGRIEIIKQGDSEIYKDRTDKFTDINDRAGKIKTPDAAPEFDFSRKTELPFKMFVDNDKAGSKDGLKQGTDTHDTHSKENEHKTASTVESGIIGNTLKDVTLDSEKGGEKYYADKSVKEEDKNNTIETQNTFRRIKQENRPKESVEKESETEFEQRKPIQKDEKAHHTHYTEHEHVHRIKRPEREDIYDVPDKIVVKHHNYNENIKEIQLEEMKDEIIDKTSVHLEKLKTQITEILLKELNKKIEEKRSEEDRKIDTIRKEISRRMTDELNKKMHEKKNSTHKEFSVETKKLKEDILSQIYHKAPHLVTSYDDLNDSEEGNTTTDKSMQDIAVYNKYDNTNEDESIGEIIPSFSGEELRVVYEQAIYYMFDNKYEDAARLFRKIIDAHPTNKAARIRLQECIEKQPELRNIREKIQKTIDIRDISIDAINGQSDFNPSPNNQIGNNITSKDEEQDYNNDLNESINEFKENMTENVEEMTDNIELLSKSEFNRSPNQDYDDKELQRMYEEAVYTMFQSNYEEAAKLFEQILKAKPENKAARIRLHECLEARSNA